MAPVATIIHLFPVATTSSVATGGSREKDTTFLQLNGAFNVSLPFHHWLDVHCWRTFFYHSI